MRQIYEVFLKNRAYRAHFTHYLILKRCKRLYLYAIFGNLFLFKNTLEITIDFRMWIQLTFDLKGSPEGHRQKKKHLRVSRKCLIFSVDQTGLEPVTSNPIERQQNTNWKSQIVTSNLDNNHGSDILKSQIAISSFAKMGLRRPPYAFTRNGVAMLSSVLRSQTAVGVNIKIFG